MATPPKTATPAEKQQAQTLFAEVWQALEAKFGAKNLRFPKRIVWLGGAPGCGKGTNTPVIQRVLKISAAPVVMSDLLNTPEMKKIKDSGKLVGDSDVIRILFGSLLDASFRDGVLVDGFPRTSVQAETVRLFNAKMKELAKDKTFPAPDFRCVVLHVGEATAVKRQLGRGDKIKVANEEVKKTGKGQLQELRATDTDPKAAAGRFTTFMEQTYAALESLQDSFPFVLINAEPGIAEVEAEIVKKLKP